MKVAVIGAGSWGTALSQVLGAKGYNVGLWARKPEVVRAINETHRNPRYLTDSVLSENIVATTSYADACNHAKAVVVVTPSNIMRQVAQQLASCVDAYMPVVLCSKGVEAETGCLPVQVFAEEMGSPERFAVLSGPNHAEEVVRGIPAGTVIAGESAETVAFFQDLFATEALRTYASDDVTGVELCAAFKNVIAISVGMSYGLGYGDNTASLLLTRGLAEMSRLVSAAGGKPLTCMGLAGTGDLVATCMSHHSRNRTFGERFAQGTTLQQYQDETHMVVEGALACKTLETLSLAYKVELPITALVRSVVWENAPLAQAISRLMHRPLKQEFYGMKGE
ncbi:MAG: NAD(P)H-dependent glycerol-3-phosphate dehydrogenase [Coriobacteriia bacterium]|nr:NAD(P)H-dependent glycerol-3-phosphate dehydrogenase [Coriobacteriia bacterium]